IMVGHADSQYEWTLNYLLGGVGMKLVLIPAVVGLVVDVVIAAIAIIMNGIDAVNLADSTFLNVLAIVMLVFVPFQIAFLFFQSHTRSVPGANDNLTGCYVGMAAVKALDEAGVRFDNTEVVMICSGSEEAGLRGAKAYAEKHLDELKAVDTCVIGIDTFRDLDDMAVYDRDMSGTVKHHAGARELMKEAAANCGFDLTYESIYIGACDAAAFTQKGIPATGFAAMDPTPPRYYHTRLDDADMLEPDTIKAAIEIMVEAACLYDDKGIKPNKK
ncbi:MAG: M20/M25/M40 family metallo-hydrolase, partial [Clostridiales bacterium]|nr:M20/M25/M40 family metallo-hydrolase [Clostridiales bacterium]